MSSWDDVGLESSDDVARLVQQLDDDEIRQIVTEALRERASEELHYDVADDLLRGSKLTDERVRELANDLERRVAERHQAESVS